MLNSNMTPRLSGHFSIFVLVAFVLKSLLGTLRQWSRQKFANLSLKPRIHVRIFSSYTMFESCFRKLGVELR